MDDAELRLDYPAALPIAAARDEILAALVAHRVVVVTGETGSGKTTQLPKMCWEHGHGRGRKIAMTEPRRLAAVSVAERLREECACAEPTIAHAVRFDDRSAPGTRIRVATDGLLLAEAARDPLLAAYDCVIVDEAHERSLQIDLLLGLLHRNLARRDDLAVVVTSATIAADRFVDYFSDVIGAEVPHLAVGGRTHPVEVRYRDPGDDELSYLEAARREIAAIHRDEGPGDVLCFLPTERDILELRRRLERDCTGATILPCFGRLNAHEQRAIFAPVRGRKIVLATNIAETSLTVPGIVHVVDCGLARTKRYHAASHTERLPIEPVACDSLAQRAGRAGRLAPGVCVRLMARADAESRPPHTEPELLRSNLAGVVLDAERLGLAPVRDFPWLDPPRPGAWERAEQLLIDLGALDPRRRTPTRLGRRLAAFGCDPQIARLVLAAADEGAAEEGCVLGAFLSVRDPRLRPAGREAEADRAHARFVQEAGDPATILALWRSWAEQPSHAARRRFCEAHHLGVRRMREWADVRRQLARELQRHRHVSLRLRDETPSDAVHRALLAGFPGGILRYREDRRCHRTGARAEVVVHPGSALRRTATGGRRRCDAPWLVAAEIVETSRVFARCCAPIELDWILELLGDRVRREHGEPFYDEEAGRVAVEERTAWRGLVLRADRRIAAIDVDPQAATRCFVDQALGGDRLPERRELEFVRANRALRRRLAAAPTRLRDRSLVLADEDWAAAYRRRLAPRLAAGEVCADLRTLARWVGEGCDLRLRAEELVDPDVWRRLEIFPSQVRIGDERCRVRYRYDPGAGDDGATVRVPLRLLPRLDAARMERLVPGLLEDWCAAALRALPKAWRRRLQPIRERARGLARAVADSPQRLLPALVEALRAECAEAPPAPDAARIEPHLWARFELVDDAGTIVEAGRDPAALLAHRPGGDDPLAALRARWRSAPSAAWPGEVPREVREGPLIAACAAVRDRGPDAGVAVRRDVFRDASAAAAWHVDGIAAACEARLVEELASLAGRPPLADAERELGATCATLRRGLGLARALAGRDREAVRDADAFARFLEETRATLLAEGPAIDRLLAAASSAAAAIRRHLARGVRGLAAARAIGVARDELERCVGGDWWRREPWPACALVPERLALVEAALAGGKAIGGPQRAGLVELADACDALPIRTANACGLREDVDRARTMLAECFRADLGGPRPSPGTAVLAIRQILRRCEDRVAEREDADRALRERALALRPFLERDGDAAAAARLRHLDRVLATFPDHGPGADPALERERLQELVADG